MPLQRFGERQRFAVNRDRFRARQPQQLHQLFHQSRIVLVPDAQRIARLIAQAGVAEVDFNMAHVFFRIAASDFLIHRQRRGQRRFFAIGAGVDLVHRPAGEQLRRRSGRRARFQYLNHPSAPFGGGGLILDIRVNAVEQAFAAQFGQLVVKIFAGLAEEFIGGIAEAKHGKCRIGQLGRFLREQELMQCDGFFRRLTFALC